MKKTTKAGLLSAFIFPGAGHIFLKSYISATVIISAACIASYYLISMAVSKAIIISNKIINGEVQADITTIRNLIEQQQTSTEAEFISRVTMALVVVWLIGIIDACRIAHKQEKNKLAPQN